MTCSHCEDLKEEIAYLRRELSLVREDDKIARLGRALGLTPSEATMLMALYGANGRYCSALFLDEAVPSLVSDDRNIKHVDVRICRIRKKIGKAAIENAWGRGYRLADIGRMLVEEALEVHARAA